MNDNNISYFDICDYQKYFAEKRRIQQWQFRCQIEGMSHDQNCVLTLTYNNENLPQGGKLSLHDYQCFLKILRKHVSPLSIRFFGCGEYGSQGLRPHYHIVIFGWCPDDLVYSHSDNSKIKFYRSNVVADIWKKGFISVCPVVEAKVIPYVCKYLQKFNTLPPDMPKPFITMSRRPGIGYQALCSSYLDVTTDKLYLNGKSCPIPRYFLDKIKQKELSNAMYLDSDGSYVPLPNVPQKELFKLAKLLDITVSSDMIREKRKSFWCSRFDFDKYIQNVKKFKKLANDKVRVRTTANRVHDGSAPNRTK